MESPKTRQARTNYPGTENTNIPRPDPTTRPTIRTTNIPSTKYSSTTIRTTPKPFSTTPQRTTTDLVPNDPNPGSSALSSSEVPYNLLTIAFALLILLLTYLFNKWRQRAKITYVIPRVFVLCSPRTVQYHYELILRVGLPASDFNPDKHDIDVTVLGQQRNEVVPMTRLNTKTLYDEPLITCLSIVVYRLVELPPLGGLLLKHSGNHKSWIFAYDFTIIDLSTNKEQFFTLNQYIGGLDRLMHLQEPTAGEVHYPIDDVPMPKWSMDDMVLIVFTILNLIFISITLMPINCGYLSDITAVLVTSLGAFSLWLFLEWLFYYTLRWDSDRREYFNDYTSYRFMPNEYVCKIIVFLFGSLLGSVAIFQTLHMTNLKEFFIWLLCVTNTCTLVVGLWNSFRQAHLGSSIVGLGLRMRGIEIVPIGLKDADIPSSGIHNKLGSTSDDGSITMTGTGGAGRSSIAGSGAGFSRVAMNIGPRSSVKSFGFELLEKHLSGSGRKQSKGGAFSAHRSRASSTGATPNNMPSSRIIARRSREKRPATGSTLHHGSSSHHAGSQSSNPGSMQLAAFSHQSVTSHGAPKSDSGGGKHKQTHTTAAPAAKQ